MAVVRARFRMRGVPILAALSLLVLGCVHRVPQQDLEHNCEECYGTRWSATPETIPAYCRYCYEIRTRDPQDRRPECLRAAYKEELDYIRDRRQRNDRAAIKLAGNHAPDHLIGVALSGGGIRSASFSLGALQALEASGVWQQTDYMSAASGGGYLAGWVQGHLGQAKTPKHDENNYDVRADNEQDLLANHGDHVEHLRTHTGFLNQGGWFEGFRMLGDWLWRWPFHLVFDGVFHVRGWFNYQHVLNVYRHRIERTYLRGTPEGQGQLAVWNVPLEDVNDPSTAANTPYFILGGNLTNHGRSQLAIDDPRDRDQWNFEFTRDFVGSDATGYVDTRAFGLRADQVLRDKTTHVPEAVVIQNHPDDNDSGFKTFLEALHFTGTQRFELSESMAASGAAFDSAAVAYRINTPGLVELGHLIVGGVFNLYLGAEMPNFASDEGYGAVFDYANMMTLQRIPRFVNSKARWLYITDGGHYDNLATLSLLRRGVQCVIAFDATADAGRNYSDLGTLIRRAHEDLGLQLTGAIPADGQDRVGHYRLLANDEKTHETKAVVLYVKSGAHRCLPHMEDLDVRARVMQHVEARRELERRKAGRNDDALKAVKQFYDLLQYGDQYVADRTEGDKQKIDVYAHCHTGLEPMSPECTAIIADCEAKNPPPSPPGEIPDAAPVDECVTRTIASKVDALERDIAHARADQEYDLEKSQVALNKILNDPDRVVQIDRLRDELRSLPAAEADRKDRIERIKAYARTTNSEGVFPHNSTLTEWYDWERFEAYRMLGYQEASTYLDRFAPTNDRQLAWCDFAALPPPSPDCQ